MDKVAESIRQYGNKIVISKNVSDEEISHEIKNTTLDEINTSAYCYAKDIESFLNSVPDKSIISKCNDIIDRLNNISKQMINPENQEPDKYHELQETSSTIYNEFIDIMRNTKRSNKK
jgi:hypothetical protein